MKDQQFWEMVFCAAVAGLHSADEAALIADEALKARAQRWKDHSRDSSREQLRDAVEAGA